MARQRLYNSDTERKAAYRQRQRQIVQQAQAGSASMSPDELLIAQAEHRRAGETSHPHELDEDTRMAIADVARRYDKSHAEIVREILHWWLITSVNGMRWPGIDLRP